MRNILSDIKNGEYKRFYLLYGEEAYLKKQYKNKLKQGIIGEDDMNYSYFEGSSVNVNHIIEIGETLPFFNEKRLIIIENSGFFKSPNEEFNDYIKNASESTFFVFVEKDVDKRGKLYKKVKEEGYISEMNIQTQSSIEKWIVTRLSAENKKITKNTLDHFIMVVGMDMTTISMELEKLIFYSYERDVITIGDIDTISVPHINGRIFDMIDAMGSKDQKKALNSYYDLIELREPPLKILFMLTRQFNIMLQVGELFKKGISQRDISSSIPLQSFIVTKVLRQLNNFKLEQIKDALIESVEIEYKIKSGNLNEKMGVELILIKYSS